MTRNPFCAKAQHWRERADALNAPTPDERAMAEAFPLGAGYGRGRASVRRIDRSIGRAKQAVAAEQNAQRYAQLADGYDAGRVSAQGRRVDAASNARSAKRADAQRCRDDRRQRACAEIDRAGRVNVSAEVWADSLGHFRGSARALVMADHAEYIATARAGGAG